MSCMTFVLFLTFAQIWASSMHPRLPPSSKLSTNPKEQTSYYWIHNARSTITEKIQRSLNQNVAKNVILFLGDGMSIPTVAAARVYQSGEESELAFDKFPYIGLAKTYAVDRQVADSANTATAYLAGVKANYGTIGVGPEVNFGDCQGMTNETNHAFSIAYYSQLKNKRTGLVTTARVTHASPAGVYAHTSDRNWESDSDIINDGQKPEICSDIASQLLFGETGKKLNVVMGGGRMKLLPNNMTDEEGQKGERSDGANLIQTWQEQRINVKYAWNRSQLIGDVTFDNLLGLFAHDHMSFNLERDTTNEPSLAEMTTVAIKTLSRGSDGYFLFLEGARIDMAHHSGASRLALNETIEFSKAIQAAVDLTDESDTLIVVTSDHAH
ncbi:membrane-bound alkaline phosphatase-like, partial [Tribolium madens]|uniref:membrane-bound alkaline phosphatase-like n=1 Tax=Tribolium madens TaxID=41895 RepID=UPI001CF72E44